MSKLVRTGSFLSLRHHDRQTGNETGTQLSCCRARETAHLSARHPELATGVDIALAHHHQLLIMHTL